MEFIVLTEINTGMKAALLVDAFSIFSEWKNTEKTGTSFWSAKNDFKQPVFISQESFNQVIEMLKQVPVHS